ncbi:uncharacterized protein LOC143625018 [Bidens hawaiensis]|uniref:uncharacterized protein LOC143625018 n=1 Tax=Bidens hawaiensis TaxID=980011 RepID=UPI00404AECDA
MGKTKTLHSFFKRKDDEQESKRHKASTSEPVTSEVPQAEPNTNEAVQNQENQQEKNGNSNASQPNNEVDLKNLERDPAKRKPMWQHSVNVREQVRRAYLSLGAYQVHLTEYKDKGVSKISDKPSVSHGYDAFTVKGFDSWKKVNGKDCAFFKHLKTSQHKNALVFAQNLLNQEGHIDVGILKLSEEEIRKNRLRLKTTIDVVRLLTFQACALRGHDESCSSNNRGNLLELLKLLVSYNDEVAKVILENAPYNSKYTSSDIQKEILSIIANKVRKHICDEVGDSGFCVMVDESRDESKKSKWLSF